MVVIRLARHGSKKRPFYHIVAADRKAPRDGRFLEKLGFLNPIASTNQKKYEINLGGIHEWIAKGATCTDRVAAILKAHHKDTPLQTL